MNKSQIAANVKALNNLAAIAPAAFTVGVSRSALIAATFACLGATPDKARFALFSVELSAGTMAAYLQRKGDKRAQAALIAHCREAVTKKAKFAGTGDLKKGQTGRRSEVEEAAYSSARVIKSALLKDAGVTSPIASGSDSSKTRAPNRKAAKGAKAKKVAASPAFKTFDDMLRYATVQAKAMSGTWSKNAGIKDPTGAGRALALSALIGDFAAGVAKLAPTAD